MPHQEVRPVSEMGHMLMCGDRQEPQGKAKRHAPTLGMPKPVAKKLDLALDFGRRSALGLR